MQAFVDECEREFEARLESSIARISDDPELCAVGLSGPTCSGKTTAAKKLTDDFSRHGKSVHIISIDDFFKDSFEGFNCLIHNFGGCGYYAPCEHSACC